MSPSQAREKIKELKLDLSFLYGEWANFQQTRGGGCSSDPCPERDRSYGDQIARKEAQLDLNVTDEQISEAFRAFTQWRDNPPPKQDDNLPPLLPYLDISSAQPSGYSTENMKRMTPFGR